jgi:hypothetical protein
MDLHLLRILSAENAERVSRTFEKLLHHDIGTWALAGGLAVELHWTSLTGQTSMRPLNDIDFIVRSFDDLPQSLANDFKFRHIHPFDPPGKTLLQSLDSENAVRIDVFRAYGAEISRCHELLWPAGKLCVVSLEDLVARSARLALDLASNQPVPAVHALDFIRLAGLVDPSRIEPIWLDHRKKQHPETFREACELLQNLIADRRELLVNREYSRDVMQVCRRCKETLAFRLADPKVMLSVFGYC